VLWIEEWSFANRGVQKWRCMYRTKVLKSIDVCTVLQRNNLWHVIVVRK